MKIVYLGGNVGPDTARHSTENAYADAFRELGHEVAPIRQGDAQTAGRLSSPIDAVKPWPGEGVELVVYTRTHNDTALGAEWTEAWRWLEEQRVKTISVHLDVMVGLHERELWVRNGDPLFTTGTVLTADGGSEAFWEANGVNHVWLPPACDTRFIPDDPAPPAELDGAKLDGAVIFVGSEGYHPQWPHRQMLIDHLRRKYGTRFLRFGPGSPLGAHRDPALTALYRADTIVVGDSCFAGERSYYWSDRVPETLGRGGLLLHPRVPGMTDWYSPSDLSYWHRGDFGTLDAQIAYFDEAGADERDAIRAHGRNTVLLGRDPSIGDPGDWRGEPDTYAQRAVQILRLLELPVHAAEAATPGEPMTP